MIDWTKVPRSQHRIINLGLRGKIVTEVPNTGSIPSSDGNPTVDEVLRATVGRVVHYVSYGTPGGEYLSVCRAAVVAEATSLPDGTCTVVVLNPKGIFFDEVAYSDQREPGSWHWPERV